MVEKMERRSGDCGRNAQHDKASHWNDIHGERSLLCMDRHCCQITRGPLLLMAWWVRSGVVAGSCSVHTAKV